MSTTGATTARGVVAAVRAKPMENMRTSNEAHRPTTESAALTDSGPLVAGAAQGLLAEDTRPAEPDLHLDKEAEEMAKEEKAVARGHNLQYKEAKDVTNSGNSQRRLGDTTVGVAIPEFTTLRARPMDPAAGVVEAGAQALTEIGANKFSAHTACSMATSSTIAHSLQDQYARIACSPATWPGSAATTPAGSYGPGPWITK